MNRLRTAISLTASLLALTSATTLQAQTVPPTDDASEADIVVTGQRASQARALAASAMRSA